MFVECSSNVLHLGRSERCEIDGSLACICSAMAHKSQRLAKSHRLECSAASRKHRLLANIRISPETFAARIFVNSALRLGFC